MNEPAPRPTGTIRPGAVAELQGLYGPFVFPEKLLQKIWLRGDFDRSRAALVDGRRLTVVQPGRWNLLGGPDFLHARLRFGDGPEIIGDVELHLHANDWAAQRHAVDGAYDGVALHVVLFPPGEGHVTQGHAGEIPVLVLLPLLLHDLEEYAAEEAVEALANRPASQIVELLGALPPGEMHGLLARQADARWRQKVHFARLRVQRLGWDEACHHTALEILGYRFNRATMLRVAAKHPLSQWAAPTTDPQAAYEAERSGWSLHGLRPANHPRRRLQQYAEWVRARPDWTGRLAAVAGTLPTVAPGTATAEARWLCRFTALRAGWEEAICGGTVGGTRFDNLVCDGFLPLLAAASGDSTAVGPPAEIRARQLWQHWFPGDLPPLLSRALRQLEVFSGRARPACHGTAQGLLGWLVERERSEAISAGRGA